MLNKNDPLIGAVQEVMKKNQAERDAARLVNEKFGIHDRKALPHEKQGAWDAAYQQVLSEGKITHPNQQALNVHEPEKPELTSDDFKKLRAKKKPMEEATDGDTTSPSSMGIKKPDYATGTPDYAKSKEQTVNRAAKTSLPAGTMKEAKSSPYAIGTSVAMKSTGDNPPLEKSTITKAHDIAKKIIARKKMNEGFNNRHDSSVTASAEKQVVVDQLNEDDIDSYENRMTAGLGGFTSYGGGRFGGGTAKRSNSSTVQGKVKASNINTRTGEPFKPTKPTPKPTKKYANAADELSRASKAKFRKTLDAKMAAGGLPSKSGNALKAPKKSPKVSKVPAQPTDKTVSQTASQPGSQPGRDASGNRIYNKAFTDVLSAAKDARVKAVSRPSKPAKSTTPAARPAKDVEPGGARAKFLARAKADAAKPAAAKPKPATTAARPAKDVEPGGARAQFLARTKADAAKPAAAKPTSPALTKAQQTKRISAIRRPVNKTALKTSVGAGLALGVAASGGDPLDLDSTVTNSNATPPKKKEITDRVPQSGALAKPSGPTAQPYGMKIPQKPAAPAPVAAKPPAAQAPAAKPPAAQAPAVKKPAPVATKPAAPKVAPRDSSTPAQRSQFNRQIDRGNAAPGTKYKGLGVTSGTTVKQKPMAINKNLPGK